MIKSTILQKLFISVLLVAGISLIAPQRSRALNGSTPIITAVTPNDVAVGFGQLITIHGFNLFNPFNVGLTEVTFTQGATSAVGYVFSSPSNPNEIYVRPPFTLTPGAAIVTVRTLDDNLVSEGVKIKIKDKPAAPVVRRLVSTVPFANFPTITSASLGSDIGIVAFGSDTSGAVAIFTQETTQISVPANNTLSNGSVGLVSRFTIPASLLPGNAFVQLRTTVNGKLGEASVPVLFTVTY